MELDQERYEHEFIIARIDDKAVLGNGSLYKYMYVWDWDKKSLSVQHKEIPCIMLAVETSCRLVLAEERIILPYSHCYIIVKGKTHNEKAPRI